jgi:hypothetical protein
MEPQSPLVGSNRTVHLDPVSAVDVDLTLIINPRHSKRDDTFGFDDPFEDPCRPILRMTLEYKRQRFRNLLYCWWNSGSAGSLLDLSHQVFHIIGHVPPFEMCRAWVLHGITWIKTMSSKFERRIDCGTRKPQGV